MANYKIKSVFAIYDEKQNKFVETFENDEVITTDRYEHSAIFGEASRKARAYVEEHGGIIVRKIYVESEDFTYSNDGNLYLTWKGDTF